MNRKLGKKPPRHDDRTLKFARYLRPEAELPKIPDSADWSAKVRHWGMMENDRLGDCTIAAAGHMIQTWSANDGPAEIVVPDEDIVKVYMRVTGGRDEGAVMLDVLKDWRKLGINGHFIEMFMALNPKMLDYVHAALDIFGGVYVGLNLPAFVEKIPTGQVWDLPEERAKDGSDEPGSWGGHAVCGEAYSVNEHLISVVTWGAVQPMSAAFFLAYCDECYAVLSKDWFGADNRCPSGFDLQAAQEDLLIVSR